MGTYLIDVAPPLPRLNITATTEELHKSPQLYFAVRHKFSVLYAFEHLQKCQLMYSLTYIGL